MTWLHLTDTPHGETRVWVPAGLDGGHFWMCTWMGAHDADGVSVWLEVNL